MGITEKYDALVPKTMPELMDFADRIAKSSLIPKEYQGKPADCLIAMSMGLEVGLKPVQALQSIAVINGRPSLWGTAARALVMASGQLQSIFETDPADVKKTQKARCEIVRKGFADPFVGEFSLEDARKAGLAVSNTYTKYLDQMLTWRAFHGAARKAFPDIYKGLSAAEELQDTAPFNNARNDDAQPITLSLDAPVTQQELDESKRQFPDPEKRKRGRPPKPQTQEPQATTTTMADKATPPTPAATGVATCGFCHDKEPPPGHKFNECPLNKVTEPDVVRQVETTDGETVEVHSVINGGRTLNDEEQAEIMRMAKLFRPKNQLSWLLRLLAPFGVEDLSDLPTDKLTAFIKAMEANA